MILSDPHCVWLLGVVLMLILMGGYGTGGEGVVVAGLERDVGNIEVWQVQGGIPAMSWSLYQKRTSTFLCADYATVCLER